VATAVTVAVAESLKEASHLQTKKPEKECPVKAERLPEVAVAIMRAVMAEAGNNFSMLEQRRLDFSRRFF
jgi:hypothetical protein